jgi:competence protein ComEA
MALVGLFGLSGTNFAGQTEKTDKKEAPRPELRVDINEADVAELTKLPGIGEQVAKRIIAYRKENGPFEKAEELMNVRGIGEKSFVRLRPYLSLGADQDKRKK